MAKPDMSKLDAPTGKHLKFRLALAGLLATALASGLAVAVRSEVRAAAAKRQAASSKILIETVPSSELRATPERDPDRQAYFGETHIHTSWSFDAYVFGNTRPGRKRPTSMRWASRSTILPVTRSRSRGRSTSWR